MVKSTKAHTSRTRKVETCKQVASLISEYLTGELDDKATLAFEEHLGKCSDCVEFFNTYKKTIQITRSFQRKNI